MIPVINTKGKPARFARGHNFIGKNNPSWNGGEYINNKGYVKVLAPNHPFADEHGHVLKHRLVMEQYLGKYLKPEEHIHHKDGNKLNNDISNLELINRSKHSKITASTNPQCQKKDFSGTVCMECGTTETSKTKNGQPHWMLNPITKKPYVCERCYRRIKHSIQTKVEKRRVDPSGWFCSLCGRTKSEGTDGRLLWYNDGAGGKWCKNCYNKDRKKKKEKIKRGSNTERGCLK